MTLRRAGVILSFLQCIDSVGWANPACKKLAIVADWKVARLIAPVFSTTSITLSYSKIQNGDILLSTYSGCHEKWPLSSLYQFLDIELHCFLRVKMKPYAEQWSFHFKIHSRMRPQRRKWKTE